jgi:hypothetical protein
MINPEKFCLAPFVQVVCRTNKTINPCCYYNNNKTNLQIQTIQQAWLGPEFQKLRETMIDETKTDPQCEKSCYNLEKQGMNTERLGLFQRHSPLEIEQAVNFSKLEKSNSKEINFPKKVEFHVSNLCNLKCLTCCPEDSSSLLNENKALFAKSNKKFFHPHKLEQSYFQFGDDRLKEIFEEILANDVETLDIRGGETMLVPYIREMLCSIDDKKKKTMSLRIQTNGTILNDQWKEILTSFKTIHLQVSIDAIEDDIHYIRHPADWSSILQILEFVKNLTNIDLTIACVISNLNLPILTKFMSWADKENFNWGLSCVAGPSHFVPNNLPETIFASAIEKIKKFQPKSRSNANVLNYLTTLSPLGNEQLWKTFCQQITLRDEYRNNSIFDLNPELKKFWIQ